VRFSAKRENVSVCARHARRLIAGMALARPHSTRDPRTSGPKRSEEAPGRKIEQQKNTGDLSEVTSISYLPTAITTLFFLAASLLLGYIQ
jgi:hypothetical protein